MGQKHYNATFLAMALVACGSQKRAKTPHLDPAENPLDPAYRVDAASVTELKSFFKNTEFNPEKITVLVVDSGFDYRHSAFENKVVASYTMNCDLVGEKADDFNFERSYEEIKQEAITTYQAANVSECQITNGIRENALKSLDGLPKDLKKRFNKAVWSKALRTDLHDDLGAKSWCEGKNDLGADVLQLCENLSESQPSFTAHGTSTAGIIAYENPNVQLVLVETNVVNQDFVLAKDADVPCLSEKKIEHLIRLYQDEDFTSAYLSSEVPFKESVLSSLYQMHQIQLENRSFILLPFNQIRLKLKMQSCLQANFEELWTLATQLEQRRVERWRLAFSEKAGLPVLFQGSGHFHAKSDTIKEYANCMFGKARVFTVGYDYVKDVSNFGACVDIHYFGSSLIVPYVSGLSVNMTGSSLSTPLLLRQFTFEKLSGTDVESALNQYPQQFYPLTQDAKKFVFTE